MWSAPDTRAKLLQGLAEKGFGHDQLAEMQKLIEAEKSDLFDVLANVAYALPPVTRADRADLARVQINSLFNAKQQAFLVFVLSHYVTVGVEELDQTKLTPLLRLKYHDSIADAVADLGKPDEYWAGVRWVPAVSVCHERVRPGIRLCRRPRIRLFCPGVKLRRHPAGATPAGTRTTTTTAHT